MLSELAIFIPNFTRFVSNLPALDLLTVEDMHLSQPTFYQNQISWELDYSQASEIIKDIYNTPFTTRHTM